MKRLTFTAVCTATVEEAWRFDVPDDFDTAGDPEEVFERVMGAFESPPGVEFRGVENVEVDDERDREIRAYGVEDGAS